MSSFEGQSKAATCLFTTSFPSPPPLPLCPGEDLHKVLWLKSRNSEVWLERRTNYTRSTAVMSMVRALSGCAVALHLRTSNELP